MNSLDALLLGPPIPHASGATGFGTNVTNLSGTSAASYTTTGTGGGTTDPSSASLSPFRFVTVHNLDASNVLYVNVGNTVKIPPDPTAGSFAIPAGQRYTFAVPGVGAVAGVQGFVKVLASAAGNGSVQWHQ